MIIDNFTIILSCAIIVVALLTSVLTNPFFRKFCEREMGNTDVADNDGNEKETADDKPKVSVVIISNGTAEQMDQHLPVLLTQDYAPGYEVVVVAVKGDSATEDVLKRYASNPHLYTTFVPGRSLFMSRAKLALTIGVKAAHNEWVLVADSRHVPQSDEWIKTMATHCDDSTDMIMGYTGYDDATTSYRRFERLREQTYFLRRAFRNEALCTKGANLMFRKSRFIQGDGYRGNLQYIQGEYDFLINKYGAQAATAVEIRPDAWLIEDEPSLTTWRNEHISFINYRSCLNGIASHRALHIADTLALHLTLLACIALIGLATLWHNWIVLGSAAAALILTFVLRAVLAGKVIRRFNADISAWKAPFMELRCFWTGLFYSVMYLMADKHGFTSHKL